LTLFFLSRSSIFGVLTGSGPSSNVSATARLPVALIEPCGPTPFCTVWGTGLSGEYFGGGLGVPEGLGGFVVAATLGCAEGLPGGAAELELLKGEQAAKASVASIAITTATPE
jgi:hypothetical protein